VPGVAGGTTAGGSVPGAALSFSSADAGWVVLGTTLDATTDGGTSWAAHATPCPAAMGAAAAVTQLVFVAPATFWGVTATALYRSGDFGATWQPVPVPGAAPTSTLVSLTFPSPSVGYLTDGSGRLWRSRDGGASWFLVTASGLPAGARLLFASPQTGWALEGARGAWATANAGVSWQPVHGWTLHPQLGSFADAAHGFMAASLCGSAGCTGSLLRTSDGGSVWDEIAFPGAGTSPPNFADCSSLDFVTAEVGFAVLDGAVYRTDDGGLTWGAASG